MISCKDFIPVYSEIFCYLESHYGRQEVDNYWDAIFKVNANKKSPLLVCLEQEGGIKGCFTYWSGTLNEEAAHFSMYLNEKRGFFIIDMHRCPSKGRLVDLQAQVGLKPYPDYCLHCDGYRSACNAVGLEYIYNFQNMDKAGCSILIYDPKIFDGRVIIDEDTVVMHRNASDNEYYHPSFHRSLNTGLNYVGNHYKEAGLREVLYNYVTRVVQPLMGEVTLASIEKMIQEDYAKEKSSDAVTTTLTENGLSVSVRYCPAEKYMRETGTPISPWYRYATIGVMEKLAMLADCTFVMDSYDEQTGGAEYHFTKN